MAAKFEFKILTNTSGGKTAVEKYADITTKQAYTFYLLESGEGFLGDTPLFGGDAEKFNIISTAGSTTLEAEKVYIFTIDGVKAKAQSTDIDETEFAAGIYSTDKDCNVTNITYKTIAQYITDEAVKSMTVEVDDTTKPVYESDGVTQKTDTNGNPVYEKKHVISGYSGDDTSIATTKAIVDYVSESINSQEILKIKFFKDVELITLTSTDITNGYIEKNTHQISIGIDQHENDMGLLFTIELGEQESTDDDDDDSYVFIPLHNLIHQYSFVDGETTTVTTKVKDASNPTIDDHTTQVTFEVNKSDSLVASSISSAADEKAKDSTYTDTYANGLSENKFVTEKQLAEVLRDILKDYVKFSED